MTTISIWRQGLSAPILSYSSSLPTPCFHLSSRPLLSSAHRLLWRRRPSRRRLCNSNTIGELVRVGQGGEGRESQQQWVDHECAERVAGKVHSLGVREVRSLHRVLQGIVETLQRKGLGARSDSTLGGGASASMREQPPPQLGAVLMRRAIRRKLTQGFTTLRNGATISNVPAFTNREHTIAIIKRQVAHKEYFVHPALGRTVEAC